jgi:hypothetical protein
VRGRGSWVGWGWSNRLRGFWNVCVEGRKERGGYIPLHCHQAVLSSRLHPTHHHIRLVEILEPVEAKINLINFNAHEGTPFARTSTEQLLAFRSVVIKGGRVCTIRDSRGDDQLAACGQLGDLGNAARPKAVRAPVVGGR